LPIEILALNFTHDGTFKHEPNPLVEENLRELKDMVLYHKADFGVCFDGDADRLMMIDEKGQSIGCDLLTALMAPYFLNQQPGSTIVYDLRSSKVVSEEILKFGGVPRRERVGHSFMKKTLRETKAKFGGELSGHFYYKDNFYADSGMLTLVHMLNIINEADSPVSELIKPLRRYAASGEMNFEVEDKDGMMKQLSEKYANANVDWLDGVTVISDKWWFNVRASNTEPLLRLNAEADDKPTLDGLLDELVGMLGEPVEH
jgi:phosphomannomutase